VETRKETRVQS